MRVVQLDAERVAMAMMLAPVVVIQIDEIRRIAEPVDVWTENIFDD